MRVLLITVMALSVSASIAVAEEVVFRTTLSEESVETGDLHIMMEPVDADVRFAITLRNTQTGFERRHEFDGQGASDPTPFQLDYMNYCDTSVILLTVKYPWRHDLPQFGRVLETFAFRQSDLKFIDIAFGPLTDIALADERAYEPSEIDMLPPISVRCLVGHDAKPFEFFEQETK